MEALTFVPFYVRWHYTRGVRDFVGNWTDILYVLIEFFALETVINTFGLPPRVRQLDGSVRTERHSLFRFGHVVTQIGLLVFGYLALVLALIVGLVFFVFWFLLPFVILFTLALSFHYFFL